MTFPKTYFVFMILAGGIIFLSYTANPHFYNFNRDYDLIVEKAYLSDAARFKRLETNCQATAQYRYDEERTGVAPSSAQPKAKVQIQKQLRPLNVDIHNASKSSPTVDESGVYVGSDSGWFWKRDHDGNVIWSFYIPGSDNGIHGSAAVDEKKVYIGAYNGFLYALDKETGEMVWANPVGNYIGASPLLAGGALYISTETYHPDGYLAKLDCNTGETKWASKWFRGHSHSSPAYDKKNGQLLVGANSGRFFAIDENSGNTNWELQLGGQVKGTPLVWDGKVYFSSWDKHYYAYDLKNGEEVWKQYMGGRNQTSLSLVPGEAIGIANTKMGDIVGLDLNTGDFLWRLNHGDRNHQFSVLISEDPERPGQFLAWSRCKESQLCVLDAKTGKLIHNLGLPSSFTSVPFAFKDKVYISLDNDAGLVILQ